ncbi:CbtA family protein [Nocardioides sp. NPDC006303]|uniref:CbtA family protein n=1 Tax=Nocardioides sp. NPDC006303 TaxID=3156747 RepID=UPI0033B1AAD9
MRELSWGRRLGTGALAGLGGGVVSAALFWILVEPSINRAIAIENAGAADEHSHHHGAEGVAAHDHGELVTRFQQQLGGTLTVVLVGILFGLAFAVAYAKSHHRMAGGTAMGRSLHLSALAFGAIVLMPALTVPANPPAVGDPDTVTQRTLAYLLTILLSILAIGAVFALKRKLERRSVPVEWAWMTTVLGAVTATAVLLLASSGIAPEIPAVVPADLIWEFRVGSLAQLAGMWAAIGVVHGIRTHRMTRAGSDLARRQRSLV